ncbi:hypothetical protein BH11PLA1_BH11PLA1_00020 [soil metagenome]
MQRPVSNLPSTPASTLLAGLLLAGVAAAGLTLGGCGSQSEQQLADVRFAPAPGMATLQETEPQSENHKFQTWDHNWRALRADMGRFLLTDKPSRLGPEPIR